MAASSSPAAQRLPRPARAASRPSRASSRVRSRAVRRRLARGGHARPRSRRAPYSIPRRWLYRFACALGSTGSHACRTHEITELFARFRDALASFAASALRYQRIAAASPSLRPTRVRKLRPPLPCRPTAPRSALPSGESRALRFLSAFWYRLLIASDSSASVSVVGDATPANSSPTDATCCCGSETSRRNTQSGSP